MNIFDPDYQDIGGQKHDKILSCRDNLPKEVVQAARNTDIDDVRKGMIELVIPMLDLSKAALVILAIRDALEKTDIPNSLNIGSSTKESLLFSTDVNYVNFLSDVTYYFANRPNREGQATIHKWKCQISDFYSKKNTVSVTVETEISGNLTNLRPTISSKRFLTIFKDLNVNSNTNLPSPSYIKGYYIDISEKGFNYRSLEKYLKGIINQYVNSRFQIDELHNDPEENNALVAEAFSAIRKSSNLGQAFCQILIYAFLECVLKAPKIMSSHEQNTAYHSDYFPNDGVHLLALDDVSNKQRYQIVFGLSCTSNTLDDVSTDVVERVRQIKNCLYKSHIMLLNPATMRIQYNDEMKSFLKRVLMGDRKVFDAFGIFVGYTIDQNSEDFSSQEEYESAVKEKLRNDMHQFVKLLETKLNNAKLISKDNPFYVYFVPFNNALSDPKEIMNKVLE